jgi:AmpE protein
MSILFSLIVVYFLQRHLANYPFFKTLQQNCSADWLDDLLFKAQMLANNFSKVPLMGSCALFLLVLSLCVLLLETIFYYASGEFGVFIFDIAILFYCFSSIAKKKYPSVFVASFEHNFGLLFWFILIGPLGAVLFWLFALCGVKHNPVTNLANSGNTNNPANHEQVVVNINVANELHYAKNISNCLFTLHTIAAWLPARITGLIFSLVGDFEKGFSCWKSIMRNLGMSHTEVLDLCGEAALTKVTLEQSLLLVERAFVGWFIFCMLIALII